MGRAFLFLFGLILLGPGLCTLGLFVSILPDIGGTSSRDFMQMAAVAAPIVIITGLLAFGGIALIRKSLRNDNGTSP